MRSIITAAAVFATAGAAIADTVDLNYTGPGAGRAVKVIAGGTTTDVFAGQLSFTVANGSGSTGVRLNGTLLTYCIDVLEPVGAGQNTYTLANLQDAPVTAAGTPGMGANKAAAIARMYTVAAGQQFGSSNAFAAAFQIAVWEVIADFDTGLDVNSGSFQVVQGVNSGVSTALGSLFAAANDTSIGRTRGLGALTNEGLQDQLYQVVVPLPGAAGMAAVGLLGVGLVTRRRRA